MAQDTNLENEEKKSTADFTTGPIIGPLIKFLLPVLAAMLIQSLYGAVDLLIVGRFGEAANVSGVALGGQINFTFTTMVTALAMGTTVILGQSLGRGNKKEAGNIIGTTIIVFVITALIISVGLFIFAPQFLALLKTPVEALSEGIIYTRICAVGMIFIVAFNVVGAIFRGLGDSKTPLITVCIACCVNIGGDLLLCGALGMAAKGAAIATIAAQAISVVIALILIKKRGLPFEFNKKCIRLDGKIVKLLLKTGLPLVAQEIVVSASFLIMSAIINSLGVVASAGAGVGGRLVAFIMLVPSALSQSLAAFIAQNIGARKLKRAKKAMCYGMIMGLIFAVVMFAAAFFNGEWLTGIFTTDPEVRASAAEYLKPYLIDNFLTSILFCMIGFFSGAGKTTVTFVQGAIGVAVRIPAALIISGLSIASIGTICCATPISTVFQIAFCGIYLLIINKRLIEQFGGDYVISKS